MEKFEDAAKKISIVAQSIEIGDNVEFGTSINVKLRGSFRIGSHSRLGSNCNIIGNHVSIGEHFFNSSGLNVGGGGRFHPNASLSIGDRCTIHNNFINVCEEVVLGDDVGLSPDVSILTHGYWLSVFEGYPATFKGVRIGNGVIIGYRSLIMMGVTITDNCVVGAQSVVTRSLTKKGIYAGSPAKFIKEIEPMPAEDRPAKLDEIIAMYDTIARYRGIEPQISVAYPWVTCRGFRFNVETFEFSGTEDEDTDDLRDYIRKWGIRIFTGRPFRSRGG